MVFYETVVESLDIQRRWFQRRFKIAFECPLQPSLYAPFAIVKADE